MTQSNVYTPNNVKVTWGGIEFKSFSQYEPLIIEKKGVIKFANYSSINLAKIELVNKHQKPPLPLDTVHKGILSKAGEDFEVTAIFREVSEGIYEIEVEPFQSIVGIKP